MLNKTSIKILKLLKTKGSLTPKEIKNYIPKGYIPDNIKLLEENGYIFNLRDDEVNMLDDDGSIVRLRVTHDAYKLMPHGKAYLESLSKDKFRFWIPIVISAIALVVSVIALYKP